MTTAFTGNLTSRLHRSPGLGKSVIATILPSSTILFPTASSYDGRLPTLSQAKRSGGKSLPPEPVSNQISAEQVVHFEEEGGELFDDISADAGIDEFLDEDDYDDYDFEDYVDLKLAVGDGREGGGVVLAGTWWDKEALSLAEKVSYSLDGNIQIYAFRTTSNSIIQVRIENLSNKYGSPTMADIEEFSSAYRTLLDEAEQMRKVPDNISLEVSSPGLERVVRVPEDLERFKDLPLYVKYVAQVGSEKESDGIFKLVSYDLEAECCTWALADVRINREQTGKGRPLSKKQREWKLQTPFDCGVRDSAVDLLHTLVAVYAEVFACAKPLLEKVLGILVEGFIDTLLSLCHEKKAKEVKCLDANGFWQLMLELEYFEIILNKYFASEAHGSLKSLQEFLLEKATEGGTETMENPGHHQRSTRGSEDGIADDKQQGLSVSPDDLIALSQQCSSELLQAVLERTCLNVACFMEAVDPLPDSAKAAYSSLRGPFYSPSKNNRGVRAVGSPSFSRHRHR